MNNKKRLDFLPMVLVNMFFLPLSIVLGSIYKSKKNKFENFFGMNVNLDKGEEQVELINELNCDDLLLRVPLSDIKNIVKYKEFLEKFENKNFTINIIQDRAHIEDKGLLEKNIRLIFSTFKGLCSSYQIGNAINENKWGFFSMKEYLSFYSTVLTVRNDKFSDYTLIGPSVKGFQMQYSVRALFNYFKIKFDKVSALMYVDSQTYPENPQWLTFDLNKQIHTLYGLSTLAIKSNNDIILSEFSWHIKGEKEANEFAVGEEEQAIYMLRYYLLALGTKRVQSVFWFQLISSTFGLTFMKNEKLEKRKSFYAYKTMIEFLKNSEVEKYSSANKLHVLTCTNKKRQKLDIVWVEEPNITVELTEFDKVYDMYGNELKTNIEITNKPIYAFH